MEIVTYNESINELINDSSKITEIREHIESDNLVIIKEAVNKKLISDIKEYLSQIGKNSLPNYLPIIKNAPNFHRINNSDHRSYVKGCFHQFVFYPWNQDLFNFFKVFKKIFQLKNLIGKLPKDAFLGMKPEKGCTARIAFQFYPANQGYLNPHRDPVNYHQLALPTVVMSKKGVDYEEGGAYFISNDQKVHIDDLVDIGDITFFNPQHIHGVDNIKSRSESSWLDFQGRWTILLAINKLSDNQDIQNAVDLTEEKK